MYRWIVYINLLPDRVDEFKRIDQDGICPIFYENGVHAYGQWESLDGPANRIIHLWQCESEEAHSRSMQSMSQDPRWGLSPLPENGRILKRGPVYQQAISCMVEESYNRIEPMPYCPEFRTFKTRAILLRTIQTKRDTFEEWTEMRRQYIPLAEEHKWVLAAAWKLIGPVCVCNEAWFVTDPSRFFELLYQLDQDTKIKDILTSAQNLVLSESSQLWRPTSYSPDYLP